jgi:hypothetical protein
MLIRIELVGRTPAFEDLKKQNEELLVNIREHVSSVIGEGEIVKVVNSTSPNVDPQEIRQRTTVLAEALKLLDSSEAPDEVRSSVERLLIEKLVVES